MIVLVPKTLRPLLADPVLRLVAAALMLVGCMAATIAPYQSLVAVSVMGLSPGQFGLLLVAASLVAVVAALGLGILTDLTARRRSVALGTAAVGVVGSGLMVLAPTPATFVLVHALFLPVAAGLFGQVFALARLASARLAPAERDGVLAGIRALFALPFIVVLPLWSVAFASGAGLLAIYPVLVVAGVLQMGMVALWWPADGQGGWVETPSGTGLGGALEELADRRVLLRVFLVGSTVSGVALYLTLIGLVFDRAAGRGPSDVALFVGIVAGLEVPVMLSVGWLLALIGRLPAILLGAAIYASFLAALPFLAGSVAVWALTIPAAVGGGIILSLPIAYLQDLLSDRPGAGGGLIALQRVASETLCAGIFAFGTWAGGYTLAAELGAGLMVLSGVVLLRLDRRRG